MTESDEAPRSGRSPAPVASEHPLTDYLLALGDDALVLSQRLIEWVSRAPELEEDVALANLALDLLGQARSLYTYAGEAEGKGRTEDDLAYLREEREFRNCQLVELPNGDFATSIARQLLFSSYQYELYGALAAQTRGDPTLTAIAAKAVKEVAYHRDHATQWVLRLGDGTDESHHRMQAGLDSVWPYAADLFTADWIPASLIESGVAVDPRTLEPAWQKYVDAVLVEATLRRPETSWRPGGGRQGLHTEAFGYLLAEFQHLHRSHPGAHW